MSNLSFPVFTVMWNQLQNQTTPLIHIRLARWLENGSDPLRLLMAFRGAGKSTMVGLYCAWRLYQNQNTRILVLAADDALARKMVRQVKRILERHTATKTLRPRMRDQWASDRFTIKRTQELRDPSMLAKGVGANITGCRADLIICDDVEVPSNCDTSDKRKELRERLAELSYILTPDGQTLYVGTPHHAQSLYQDEVDTLSKEQPFLIDATRLEIPILNENGQSAWAERFSLSTIENIKKQTGPLKFASQMMLQAVSLDQARLDADLLSVEATPNERHVTQKIASWDPSFGSKTGDGSVLAIVSALYDGRFYIDDVHWLNATHDDTQDAARAQCRAVIYHLKRYGITRLLLESNGIGKFLPSILRRELREARYSCAVIDITQTTNKSARILSAFDPLLASRSLVISPRLKGSALIDELRKFSPSKNSNRDDGLDAVATALLNLNQTFQKA